MVKKTAPVQTEGDFKELLALVADRREDALSVLNGFFGDTFAKEGYSLATPMGLFSGDQQLSLDSASLRDQVPKASRRICVLVHGVMANPGMWRFTGDRGKDYGTLLEADRGITPVYLRYNSGLHISSNAQELAALLDDLVAAWPVEVEELSLIAHSMGGLVCRSACHYADAAGRGWPAKVKRVFLLGVPIKGAPLEKIAHLTSFTLTTIFNPWTKFIGWIIKQRSAGIKDLRHGFLLDEDWQAKDPDALFNRGGRPVPLLDHVEYFVAVGNLWKNAKHPLAKMLGDALVPEYSARGEQILDRKSSPFAESNSRVFPQVNHQALLNHPDVYAQICDWWQPDCQQAP